MAMQCSECAAVLSQACGAVTRVYMAWVVRRWATLAACPPTLPRRNARYSSALCQHDEFWGTLTRPALLGVMEVPFDSDGSG